MRLFLIAQHYKFTINFQSCLCILVKFRIFWVTVTHTIPTQFTLKVFLHSIFGKIPALGHRGASIMGGYDSTPNSDMQA